MSMTSASISGGSRSGVRIATPGVSARVRSMAAAGPSIFGASTTTRIPVSAANDLRAFAEYLESSHC